MRWKKLGRIFVPDGSIPWMQTHAANPVARHLEKDLFRIYFSTRDDANKSSIGFIDINIKEPQRILNISQSPILSPGSVGLFDDSGVSMGCLANINGTMHLYYLGWNLKKNVPWMNAIGLAKENSQGIFEKVSQAPIMDRHECDPYSLSYPWVVFDAGKYKMWYGSNLSWGEKQESMAHLLKYAESEDGYSWVREGKIAINFQNANQYAISKPSIIKDNDCWKMWYSYRGESYKIGYAESLDGLRWERKDKLVSIDRSKSGWDSDSIEYPCVIDHQGIRYMLYNGNSYGKTGFGIARFQSI